MKGNYEISILDLAMEVFNEERVQPKVKLSNIDECRLYRHYRRANIRLYGEDLAAYIAGFFSDYVVVDKAQAINAVSISPLTIQEQNDDLEIEFLVNNKWEDIDDDGDYKSILIRNYVDPAFGYKYDIIRLNSCKENEDTVFISLGIDKAISSVFADTQLQTATMIPISTVLRNDLLSKNILLLVQDILNAAQFKTEELWGNE